MNFYYLKLA